MNPLEPFLQNSGIVILDGGLATDLERRGAILDDPLWSAKLLDEKPALIGQVHLDYLAAGADVITSASYQATLEGFGRKGFSKNIAKELLKLSIRLAKEAVEEFWGKKENRKGRICPLVAASIGPYGAYLADGSEYVGRYNLQKKQLMDFHRPRMEVLAEAGPDLLAFETIPCIEEAEALARLLEEMPVVQAWLSFSCRNERETSKGESIEDGAALAEDSSQIIATGVNCTAPNLVKSLLEKMKMKTGKPLLAYPNSGEKWNAAESCWISTSQKLDFTKLAKEWYGAGARLIGGCCRTTPDDIRKLAAFKKINTPSTL